MKTTVKLLWITFFSISMGLLESAVVIYLRKIYYPDGFSFPLVIMDSNILLTELLREAATIIMLLGIGILTGMNRMERFAYFLYSFAIWDIFYYFFLKIVLDWPSSLFTWDILFLIPVTWTGPVIAPLIVSITMILLALLILCLKKIPGPEVWIMLCSGAFIIIISFIWDYCRYLFRGWNLSHEAFISYAGRYCPFAFPWYIFIAGEIIILAAIILILKKDYKKFN